MRWKIFFVLISGIVLAAILGFQFFSAPNNSGYSSPSLPEFQPGIWDQPVIRPPTNSSAGLFDYPFMYQYDLNDSTGFERVYKKYYRPTYAIAPGKNATVVINVTSYSRHPITVSLAAIDDLPDFGLGYMNSTPILLNPGESGRFLIRISASPNAVLPEDSALMNERERKLAIGPWLESDGWQIGQGFYLMVKS